MGSTLTKLVIHCVFHVKPKWTNIRESELNDMWAYMGGIVRNEGCIPLQIGGIYDHVHLLIAMSPSVRISDLVRNIKNGTTKWLKERDRHFYNTFKWQEGYGAFSVSPSFVEPTVNYIKRQAEHHKKEPPINEYRRILDGYGVQYDERYAFE